MEEGPNEAHLFWEKALLPNDDCVFHALVPTMFITKVAAWDRIKNLPVVQQDSEMKTAHRRNLMCALCNVSLQGEGSVVCIRLVLGKREAVSYPDEKKGYMYMSGVNTASICLSCADAHRRKHTIETSIAINSETNVHNALCDVFEGTARTVCFDHFVTANGEELILADTLSAFRGGNKFKHIMHLLGKFDCQCRGCGNANAKSRCSGCEYFRFCNAKCMKRAWKEHQYECRFLKKRQTVFLPPIVFKK